MGTEPSPRHLSSIHELESLCIARKREKRSRRLVPLMVVIIAFTGLGAIGYELYGSILGRPPEVQTALVSIQEAGQPRILLTGSGYIVTQHKYITVGTKQFG